jgi:LysM repeat protein
VRSFVESGYLVPVIPGPAFELKEVSFPYARPEVRVFVDRLSSQYRSACGETLVVTSLTRPLSAQPRNASDRSVHPTGMAVDLRRSTNQRCRGWLESTLLSLEAQGVLDVTYERNPPHYHVAIFPQPYIRYVSERTGMASVTVFSRDGGTTAPTATRFISYPVSWGETLSEIALAQGTSVSRLRAENELTGDLVRAGQVLRIPVFGAAVPRAPVVAESPASRPVAQRTPEASGEAIRHRVRSGESLWTIARLYDVTEGLLRAANGISGSRILIGQALLVPLDAVGSGVLRYRVQDGDSLGVIAQRLGTTVEQIQERNRMDSTRIFTGQTLDVPLTR